MRSAGVMCSWSPNGIPLLFCIIDGAYLRRVRSVLGGATNHRQRPPHAGHGRLPPMKVPRSAEPPTSSSRPSSGLTHFSPDRRLTP
jgi:hypothetical protein